MLTPDLVVPSPLPLLAGIGRRLCALCYEILLLIAVVLVLGGLFQLVFPAVSFIAPLKVGLFIYEVTLIFIYFGFCWMKGGQTLAMKTWRICLRNPNGKSIHWRQALMRCTVVFIAVIPMIPVVVWAAHQVLPAYTAWMAIVWAAFPYAWALIDTEKQFLHDRLVGTRLEFTPGKS